MSFKSRLIKEVGEERAKELLSERGREMRAAVKKPTGFTSKSASKAAKIRWGNKGEKNKTKGQKTIKESQEEA